jgi:hypothetical protein
MDDLSNYDKLKADSQAFFASLKPVHSPALNEVVFFNAEGFNHIVFKSSRHERERISQIMRFKLLPRAVELVSLSTTYQEYEETLKEFLVKERKAKVKKSKKVQYWGLIAIIGNRKIKVILRKIGDNGQLHFWSIVPAWTTNKYRDIKFVSTMKGNPDED